MLLITRDDAIDRLRPDRATAHRGRGAAMAQETAAYYVTLRQQTVAQLLLAYLELEGAVTLFGIPGATIKTILNELKVRRDVFTYVICRHETGAAFMADGYARVTDGLGVVLVTSGPGATNALTGTVNANSSGSAVLTISGEVPEQYIGMGYLQEGIDANLDVDAIYRNAARYSAVVVSATSFQTLIGQALRDALSLPRRAAHLSIPDNVAAATLASVAFPKSPANYRTVPDSASPAKAQQAFERLTRAERPLIFLGNGCRRALKGPRLASFSAFVEKFAIPVMTAPGAKGIFPESHALSLRTYGLAACEWPARYLDPTLLARYDALLVMGSSLGELATSSWNPALIPAGPIIQVDLDQSVIARAFPIELGIVADVGAVVDELFSLSEASEPDRAAVAARRAAIAEIKSAVSPFRDPDKRASDAAPILPQALMRCLNDHLPAGAHIFVDSANCVGWTLHYLVIDPPTRFHISLGMGPMGFGVGAVVGGKIGAPDRPCVAIVGDGAFLMHGGEVSTAAQNGVGAIWVVLYDNDLAMVSQGINEVFPDPAVWHDYYKIGAPDVAKIAEGLGAAAYAVHSPADMRRVFPTALRNADAHKQPQVIVAHINTDEIPPYYPA
jgi:acetolactate synthase-1/2/3 large subunit